MTIIIINESWSMFYLSLPLLKKVYYYYQSTLATITPECLSILEMYLLQLSYIANFILSNIMYTQQQSNPVCTVYYFLSPDDSFQNNTTQLRRDMNKNDDKNFHNIKLQKTFPSARHINVGRIQKKVKLQHTIRESFKLYNMKKYNIIYIHKLCE